MPLYSDLEEWLENETLTREEAVDLIKAIRERDDEGPWSVSMSKDESKMFIRRDGPTAFISSAKKADKFIKLINDKFADKLDKAA